MLLHLQDEHFERIAEQKLDKNLPIVTTYRAAASLKKKGFIAPQALQTWETLIVVKGEAVLHPDIDLTLLH